MVLFPLYCTNICSYLEHADFFNVSSKTAELENSYVTALKFCKNPLFSDSPLLPGFESTLLSFLIHYSPISGGHKAITELRFFLKILCHFFYFINPQLHAKFEWSLRYLKTDRQTDRGKRVITMDPIG